MQTACHTSDAKCQVLMQVLFRLCGKEGRLYCSFGMDKRDVNWEINCERIGAKLFSGVSKEMQK